MWHKEYEDYPIDEPLRKERVESGKGIVGCEMHEINGWGQTLHSPKVKKRGLFAALLNKIFGSDPHA